MLTEGAGLYAYIGATILLASATASLMGFGFALMATPLIVLVLHPAQAVPALMLAYMPLGIAICIHRRTHLTPRRILIWLLGAIPGLVLGIWILRTADAMTLKRFIGAITIVSTALLMIIRPRPAREHQGVWLSAGAASGILGGATGMSGPPVVLPSIYCRADPAGLRADLPCYFTALNVFALAGFWHQGMITADTARFAAVAVPSLILGFFAGNWAVRHFTGDRFHHAAAALMILTGLLPWLP